MKLKKKIILNRYIIYSNGKIFDLKRRKFLKGNKDKDGYIRVNINNVTTSVHRLVAKAFIPNPENKPQVNHINGIKDDNHLKNLEWATNSENQKHAYRIGLARPLKSKDNPYSKTVYVFDKEGILIDTIIGLNEASRKYNLPLGTLADQSKKTLYYKNIIDTEYIFSYNKEITIKEKYLEKAKKIYVYNKDKIIIDTVFGGRDASKKYKVPRSTVLYQCKLDHFTFKNLNIFFNYNKDLK